MQRCVRPEASKIAHADAAAAHLSALAATIYGQFDRAREELAAVDWDKTPAMYRGHRLHVLALIALLEKQDAAEALRLAAEARALEQTDPAGSLPILHDAILVAAGRRTAMRLRARSRPPNERRGRCRPSARGLFGCIFTGWAERRRRIDIANCCARLRPILSDWAARRKPDARVTTCLVRRLK